nr:HEAT repeat domain-containing protein [Myxococcota bacterium]
MISKYRMDPIYAAEDNFVRQLKASSGAIVPRSDKELLSDAENHSDPAVREHALFEYSYRKDQAGVPTILKIWEGETDPDVRISVFDELVRLDYEAVKSYLEWQGVPKDVAHQALAHYDAGLEERVAGSVQSDPDEIFDQTIPLRVMLREYIEVEPNKWLYHIFAPIQERRVAGQLLACTKVETRHERVVLTKHLEGLNSD